MIVGTCRIELYLPDNNSLKAKRQVVKSIKAKLRHKFNISVAEIEHHDLWQRATLGVAYVGHESRPVNQALCRIVDFVDNLHQAVISDYHIEISAY